MTRTVIHWFRQDLRLGDNPAFAKAVATGSVLPVYILDDEAAKEWRMGSASRWWLHHALLALNEQLDGHLRLFHGRAMDVIPALVRGYEASMVSWTRCYEPWRMERDREIVGRLKDLGCENLRLNGSLLMGALGDQKGRWFALSGLHTLLSQRAVLQAPPPAPPDPTPGQIAFATANAKDGAVALDALGLQSPSGWGDQLARHWEIGEGGAGRAIDQFIASGLKGYKAGRNFPARPHVSRLSPYLHWGQISPNQVWHAIQSHEEINGPSNDLDHFRSELGWREFSHHLLYHNPDLPSEPLNKRFDAFDWKSDPIALMAWQKGQTGVPDRRRWDAAIVADRIYAQSGAHDRCVFSGQKSSH